MKLSKIFIAITTLTAIAACDPVPQTTTGADFTQGNFVDSETRKAANVKPLLKFPAKFCITKMENGKMLPTQSRELQLWQTMAARHRDWGTFSQINEMTVSVVGSERLGSGYGVATMADVRAAAARQHCHAILTYQIRKDNSGYVASGLLFDTRNGYTYLSGSSADANANGALTRLVSDFESGMSDLRTALQ